MGGVFYAGLANPVSLLFFYRKQPGWDNTHTPQIIIITKKGFLIHSSLAQMHPQLIFVSSLFVDA